MDNFFIYVFGILFILNKNKKINQYITKNSKTKTFV